MRERDRCRRSAAISPGPALRFPDEGTVFDYFIDPNTKKGEPKRCTHWRDIIPGYTHDRAATYAARRRMSMDVEDPPEMSLYDQAKGVVGRMQLGQDITKLELPATFLTPFSAIQASEDVLTIIAGTERSDEDWKALSDASLDAETRFLNVLRLFLDMESLRCEEGTGGGTKSAFTMPPMKKPINSVLGETHSAEACAHYPAE